jgi:hypothetical protein
MERGHRYPQFLPDGVHFLFVAIGSDARGTVTYAASVRGGKPVEVFRGVTMGRFAAPDHLLSTDRGPSAQERPVMARRFDPRRRRVFGEPQRVLDRVSATNFGYPNLTADARGTLVVQHWGDPHSRVFWRDRAGRDLGVAIEDLQASGGRLSPDGRWFAHAGPLNQDIYLRDMTSGVSRRLTFENQDVSNLVWSPDGRRIAFARLFGYRGWQARVKSLDSGQDSSLYESQTLFNFPQCWSRDGRWLVVLRADSTNTGDLWKVDMGGGGASSYHRARGEVRQASLSPDAKWIAYIGLESGRPALFVQTFPEPGNPYEVAVEDPAGMVWDRPDAIGVGTAKGEVLSIAVSTDPGFQQGPTTRLFRFGKDENVIDVAQGGQRFLVGRLKDASSLTRLEVLLDWTELLAER